MTVLRPHGTRSYHFAQAVLVVLAVIMVGLVVFFALTSLDDGLMRAPSRLPSPRPFGGAS